MKLKYVAVLVGILFVLAGAVYAGVQHSDKVLKSQTVQAVPAEAPSAVLIYNTKTQSTEEVSKVVRSNDAWRETLSPRAFWILRQAGTEQPFTGALLNNKQEGVYQCAACGTDLFLSETKFKSGTGWPSFTQTVSDYNVRLVTDTSHGMNRVEVVCARCDGHLGHVFNDGPAPTFQRYCINSGALQFQKD